MEVEFATGTVWYDKSRSAARPRRSQGERKARGQAGQTLQPWPRLRASHLETFKRAWELRKAELQ